MYNSEGRAGTAAYCNCTQVRHVQIARTALLAYRLVNLRPVKGVYHVSKVRRHNLSEDGVIASWGGPTDEDPHEGQQGPIHQGHCC